MSSGVCLLVQEGEVALGFLKMLIVEHLEKSSPLIVDEVHRWRNIVWEDYVGYQAKRKRKMDLT